MRSGVLACLVAVVVLVLSGRRAEAHGMRSVYVEVVEGAPGLARVAMRAEVPVTGVRIAAEAPCALDEPTLLVCPGSVAGARLRVDGLGAIVSEAVLFVQLADGTTTTLLVTPERPAVTFPTGPRSSAGVATQYVGLGVEHIVTGADHLLFLLGLVLVLRSVRAVLLAETAFTLSHSVSYSASALGWVRVSSGAVEACIALSLVLVALEAMRGARLGGGEAPSRREVWQGAGLAFVFGLVHGLGFAGGLSEIGLPDGAIPAALAGFACGVEIGQVAFLAIVLALFALVQRWRRVDRALSLAATYAVGAVGFFWVLDRVRALLLSNT